MSTPLLRHVPLRCIRGHPSLPRRARWRHWPHSPSELQLLPDVIAVDTGFLGGLREDLAVHRHLDEAVVHRDGALVGAREHEALHLRCLALADQILDRLSDDHDLRRHDAAVTIRAHEELLAEDGLQGRRKLQADLALPRLREHAYDSVDGVYGAVCVQRREDEVAGLGGGQRGLDRGEVTHLTDQDDVRILTQDGAQSFRVGQRVGADLALIDDALVRRVDVLDRILQRDDVLVPRVVDLIENRRQCRRLTGAGFTGDQHDALLKRREAAHHLWEAECIERRDALAEDTQRRRDVALLPEQIDTHTLPRDRRRAVELTDRLDLLVVHTGHLPREPLTVLRCQHLLAQIHDLPVETALRRQPRDQMDIRRTTLRRQ